MKVVCILQARMGSTRLPGKVLLPIEGSPVLLHMLQRLSRSREIHQLVVATSTASQDDPIEEVVKTWGGEVFRGNELDVLDRYTQCAGHYDADIVVRVTGDCPLIDPDVTDRVIRALLDQIDHFDFASNTVHRSWPRGLDSSVFRRDILETAWKEAVEPAHREHVALFFHHNPQRFRLLSVRQELDESAHRWTLDTPDDLAFIREIYRRLTRPGQSFGTRDVLELITRHPDLAAMNAHVHQKEV